MPQLTSRKQTRFIPAWVVALTTFVLLLFLSVAYVMFWPRHSNTPLAGPSRQSGTAAPPRGAISSGRAAQPQPVPGPTAIPQPIVPTPPVEKIIPASTQVTIRLSKLINSAKDTPGSRFPGTIVLPLDVNGQIVVQQGAGVLVRLIEVKKTGFFHRSLKMKLALTGISVDGRIYPTQSEVLQVEPNTDGNSKEGKALVMLPNTQLTFSLSKPLLISSSGSRSTR